MKKQLCTIGSILMMTALLSMTSGLAVAEEEKPLKPEAAAKKENHRKQKEQLITPEKRKAAAEALKAERLKLHKAKQDAAQSQPAAAEIQQK